MKKGFTIVEIIVVIGIIAILTVIVFPAINNIRAKNRDTERVADIATIQLGLSLFHNQSPTGEYPKTIFNNPAFSPKYVPADALVPPNNDPSYQYQYVPLKRVGDVSGKCVYYHLGVNLELGSAQIDTADQFSSLGEPNGNGYDYCSSNITGFAYDSVTNPLMYAVHP